MGWTGILEAPDSDKIRREFTNQMADGYRVTDVRVTNSGRNYWGIVREGDKPLRIVHWMVQRGRHDWAYKPMDETWGPVETDCPLALLDLCPLPDGGGYAEAWRERVRAYHRERLEQRAMVKAVKAGSILRLKGSTLDNVDLTVIYRDGSKTIVEFSGGRYAVPMRLIASVR